MSLNGPLRHYGKSETKPYVLSNFSITTKKSSYECETEERGSWIDKNSLSNISVLSV